MSTKRGSSMGGMLALGMGVGAAIGAATDNIGMWVAIGVAVGVGAAGLIDILGKTKSSD